MVALTSQWTDGLYCSCLHAIAGPIGTIRSISQNLLFKRIVNPFLTGKGTSFVAKIKG